MPIDRFFCSLAKDYRERSIGVILSGTGSDGSRGVRDIHAAGGLVICESPETATFDGMPKAAIETGVVHQVMPPGSIATILSLHKDAIPLDARMTGETNVPTETIDEVFQLLNDEFGIDFSHYKPNTVSRRIQHRLSLVGMRTLEEYSARLTGRWPRRERFSVSSRTSRYSRIRSCDSGEPANWTYCHTKERRRHTRALAYSLRSPRTSSQREK